MGNYKRVKGKHKWYQITKAETKKNWKHFHFGWSNVVHLSCHPINFLPDKRSESAERGEACGFKAKFCCHFLQEASVGVRRCLWGGLVALCTTSPSLPPTGIWWQTRFNLPAMSSWVQLLIAGVEESLVWWEMSSGGKLWFKAEEGMDSGSFGPQMAEEKSSEISQISWLYKWALSHRGARL